MKWKYSIGTSTLLLLDKLLHMNGITIRGLHKKYGDFEAVKNLDLTVSEGEFFGFLGPNGAGKSTTIHCITGISQPTSGSIEVYDKDVVKDYREARALVGLSPQEFNIDVFATAEQILWFVAGYYGMTKQQRKDRIEELLEIFELQSHRKKPFRTLSGGLKRRVMLARAMVHDPKVLILDEPTAGVDVELRHELWDYLKKINEAGKTIILTSHYLEEVQLLCSRIGFINHGELITIGEKSELVEKYGTLEKAYLEVLKK